MGGKGHGDAVFNQTGVSYKALEFAMGMAHRV